LTISSCTKDEDTNSYQSIEDVRGAVINLAVDGTGFYNLGDASATTGFSLDDFGEDVSSVTVMKSVNGATAVEETKITSFPSSLSFDLNQALAGTGIAVDDVAVGDNVTYTFRDVTTGSGVYPSGRSLVVPITCPGQLDGEFDITAFAGGIFASPDPYVGKVRFEDAGGGNYNISTIEPTTQTWLDDPSFGAYYAGYGTADSGGLPNGGGVGNVQVNETCGVVSFIGASQWGEIYQFNTLTTNGAVMSISWENDYGEAGTAEITRTDGTDWASNLGL
jgi:hypothetical protein